MDVLVLSDICRILGRSPGDLNLDAGFVTNGGDSLGAAALSASCRSRGLDVSREKILLCSSLRDLLQETSCGCSVLTTPTPPGLSGSAGDDAVRHRHDLDDRREWSAPYGQKVTPSAASIATVETTPNTTACYPDQDPGLTEMQQSLIQGSLKFPGTNTIIHSETYYSDLIPTLREAWKTVLESEPVFRQISETGYYLDAAEEGVPANATFRWIEHRDAGPNVEEEEEEDGDDDGDEDEDARAGPGLACYLKVVPISATVPGEKRGVSKITWVVHHALVDGYSAALVLEKVLRLANDNRTTGTATTAQSHRPGPSFSHFVRQLAHYQAAHREAGDEFWDRKKQSLAMARTELLLPRLQTTASRPSDARRRRGGHGPRSATVKIDASHLRDRLRMAARENGVTPPAYYHAAWAQTLATYADSDAVVFGTALSGRTMALPEAMHVVGPLVNTLPLAVTLPDPKCKQSTRDFVRSVFHHLVELESFQWTTPANGFTRDFQTAVTVQFAMPSDPAWTIAPISRDTRQDSEIPLVVIVGADGKVELRYQRHVFSRRHVERVAVSYLGALELLLEPGHLSFGEVVSDSWRDLLGRWGNWNSPLTRVSSVREDLVTLFERQARERPEAIAAEINGEHGQHGQRRSLSYGELDAAAGRVASRISRHVCAGKVVCVGADRSLNWLVAIMAVLKAGGVYCPLDSALPSKAADQIYVSSGATCYLASTTDSLPSKTPASCTVAFSIESLLQEDNNDADDDDDDKKSQDWAHRETASPASAAYACFTSGSTGAPKGVLCTHEGLVAFQSSLEVRLFAQPGRRIAQVMSVAFDGSVHELFSALTHGATLVLPAGADPFAHLHAVDAAILTPSLARVLDPQEFKQLKWVYLVGEPVPQSVSDRWSTWKQLYNMYGPTEGTCGATIKRLLPGQPVTIGVPNPTTRVYVLTSRLTLAQPGMIGDIYLAGIQVARGYINLPSLTRERFLPDSILQNGERMYATGDRGYWNEEGEIVCLGRRDREIKLRGYRLDLADLEIRISRAFPELKAVAVARQAPQGDRLVAMVQPASIDVADLRRCLAAALPHYAIPHFIIPVDKLPVTSAGKMDYNAVANAATGTVAGRITATATTTGAPVVLPFKANRPMTATERLVASAYSSVLGLLHGIELDSHHVQHVEDGFPLSITPASRFVELGGNSLQQLQLGRHLVQLLGKRVPIRTVLEKGSVEELARAIEELEASPVNLTDDSPCSSSSLSPSADAHGSVVPACRLGDTQLSPIEQEWLHKYSVASGSGISSFNVCLLFALDTSVVDRNRLARAWNVVLARHRLLSSRYIAPHRPRGRARRDFSICPPRVHSVRDGGLDVWAEANRPFCLGTEDPVRVLVSHDRLLVVLSHIVADYTALGILVREASEVYNNSNSNHHGRGLPDHRDKTNDDGNDENDEHDKKQRLQMLQPAPKNYFDATIWYESPPQHSLDFWAEYLHGCPEIPPMLGRQTERAHYCGTSAVCVVDRAVWAEALAFCASGRATLQQLALAAVAACLDPDPAASDVVVGAPFMNRRSVEDLETFGLFLEPLPVRIRWTDPEEGREEQQQQQQSGGRSPGGWNHDDDDTPGSGQQQTSHTYIDSVRQSTQSALANAMPWHQLLAHIGMATPPDYPNHPLLDVMVTVHDFQPGRAPDLFDMRAPGFDPCLVWSQGAKFKLLVELTAISDTVLLLRLEYDADCLTPVEVDRVQRQIPMAMALIARGVEHGEMKKSLLAAGEGTCGVPVHVDGLFGMRYSEIRAKYGSPNVD